MMNLINHTKKIKKQINMIMKSGLVVGASVIAIAKTLLSGKRSIPRKELNDEIILILGNGPSLSEIDFNTIDDDVKIACVNYFALKNPCFETIKPSYYCLADPVFFGRKEELPEDIQKLYGVLEKVTWQMVLIAPQKACIPISNDNITIEYLPKQNIGNDYLPRMVNYFYRRNLIKCGWQNVVIGVLHYFCMQKVKTIYIAGVDMSEFRTYTVDERNHVLAEFEHFYGIDKDDRTEKGEIPQGGFGLWLQKYAKMFIEFIYISRFASSQNVTIKNLSLTSYVDVFPKEHWSVLVNNKR